MTVQYCKDCRWMSSSCEYCEHPEVGFISGAPYSVTKGICQKCEEIRKDGLLECDGFTPFTGLTDKLLIRIAGVRL